MTTQLKTNHYNISKEFQQKTIFGRRRIRRIRKKRAEILNHVMKKYEITAWDAIKTDNYSHIWLEIGFGSGEHLHWKAQQNPSVLMIGAEYFINGIAALSAHIERENITNIRIYNGNAQILLEEIPDGVIDKIFILFPDPWPKKRHHKRRLITPAILTLLHKIMRPRGELQIASDCADYIAQILIDNKNTHAFHWQAEGADEWRIPPNISHMTRYQRKALAQKRACSYLIFKK